MLATIQKWGNSQAIRLPKAILETALLKENESVEIVVENNKIIIKKTDIDTYKPLNKYLEEYFNKDIETILTEVEQSTLEPIKIACGKPVGEELW